MMFYIKTKLQWTLFCISFQLPSIVRRLRLTEIILNQNIQKMQLTGNFEFHAIGQGGFYTGMLGKSDIPSDVFHFVYDCGKSGSTALLKNEVADYQKIISGHLDLLIISHFHEDHINGIRALLTGITCRRVIIPYYEPEERLLLYATTPNASEDYIIFLQDPI